MGLNHTVAALWLCDDPYFSNGSDTGTERWMPELLTSKKKKRQEEDSLLNRPSCPPDDPIGQGTEPK